MAGAIKELSRCASGSVDRGVQSTAGVKSSTRRLGPYGRSGCGPGTAIGHYSVLSTRYLISIPDLELFVI